MDKRKQIGRTAAQLQTIFDKLPDATFCLDIGHARQIDPTMMEASLFLRMFSDRLRQVHKSFVNTQSRHERLSFESNSAFRLVSHWIKESIPIILAVTIDEVYRVVPAAKGSVMSSLANVPQTEFDFETLVTAIQSANVHFTSQVSRAVNISITLRSWVIGFYIVGYEQGGKDRAEYGMRLIDELSKKLSQLGLPRVESRDLRRYRSFAICYPQIRQSLTAKSPNLLSLGDLATESAIRQSATAISGERLISSLSFTHICELLRCEEPEKRAFYEDQCIRGSWSVRELKRQIGSLLYERSELSINKQKLVEKTHSDTDESALGQLTIRDPYIFEFLGLTPLEVMSESHLEDQLLNKLQAFLLELGQGFCFQSVHSESLA